MSLEQLIFEKKYCPNPRGASWISFLAQGGPAIVASNQTCFNGGTGPEPRISDRRAGTIFPSHKLPFPCINCNIECSEEPNYCWQGPCNVVIPLEKPPEGCKGKRRCRRRSNLFLVR